MTSDDAVGYGKPPKHSQFKKGQSGNPRGCPKVRKDVRTRFHDIMNKQVVVTEEGREKKMSKLEVGLSQLMNKAASGDFRAIKAMLYLCRELGYTDNRADPVIIVVSEAEDKV